jgi:hypothetical protein
MLIKQEDISVSVLAVLLCWCLGILKDFSLERRQVVDYLGMGFLVISMLEERRELVHYLITLAINTSLPLLF